MNIHVTKLDIDTGGENLRQVFEEFGEVLFVKIITDKITVNPEGSGLLKWLMKKMD